MGPGTHIDDTKDAEHEHVKDVQQAGAEVKDMLQQVFGCNLTNTIHIAKLVRIGEAHRARAKAYNVMAKADIAQARRRGNDCTPKGIRNFSNAISGPELNLSRV